MVNSNGKRARALDTLPHDDTVTLALTQYEFLWQWMAYADATHPVAVELAAHVAPEVFADEFYREVYEFCAEKVVRGESVSDSVTIRHVLHIAKTMNRMDAGESIQRMRNFEPGAPEDLKNYGRTLVAHRRGLAQVELCTGAALATQDAMSGLGSLTVKQVADNLMDRLVNLHSRLSENGGPVTQEEITEHLLARVNEEGHTGVDWPYQCMQRQLGPISAGDVVGISAYSGNGKTMFVANLFLLWALARQPVIVYPTEMGLRFLERVVAILARVPKRFAEKGDWRGSTAAQQNRYREAMRSLVGLPWDIVKEGDLSPADIIARAKVLRRKHKGKHVIVIVDHAHRLRYAHGVKADDALGAAEATRMFKNHATSDTDGGLSYVVLFQPSQPQSEELKYRPVSMYKIRGHSGSTTELDAHLSCYRRLVLCDTTGEFKTSWGSPSAIWHPTAAMPEAGDYEERGHGTKLDDEHFYLTSDKDRVNGEILLTHMLRCHAPSGFIYENDWLHGVDAEDYYTSQANEGS